MNQPFSLRVTASPAEQVSPAEPDTIYKVELDERCFLFPDGKQLGHLLLTVDKTGTLSFDAVYGFNKTRLPARFLTLQREETRLFVRELIDAVYAAKPAFVLTDTIRITINVVANGYRIEFLRAEQKQELFLSTSVIWRLVKAMLMAVDEASPIVAN